MRAEVWRVWSWEVEMMWGVMRRESWWMPRIEVEAAMPREPPRTRAWAIIPCATAVLLVSSKQWEGEEGTHFYP